MHEVAKGPETLVGEAIVVASLLFLCQPHPSEQIRLITGRNLEPTVLVAGIAIRTPGAVSDPHTRAGAHDGIERSNQSAGGLDEPDTVVRSLVDVWLSVRHNDYVIVAQSLAQESPQPLNRPDAGGQRAVMRDGLLQRLANLPQQGAVLGGRRL